MCKNSDIILRHLNICESNQSKQVQYTLSSNIIATKGLIRLQIGGEMKLKKDLEKSKSTTKIRTRFLSPPHKSNHDDDQKGDFVVVILTRNNSSHTNNQQQRVANDHDDDRWPILPRGCKSIPRGFSTSREVHQCRIYYQLLRTFWFPFSLDPRGEGGMD
jgi:hypothetical protein